MIGWLRQTLPNKRSARLLVIIACLPLPAWLGWLWLKRPNEARLLQRAIRLADRGERPAAARLLDEVLRRNPAHAYALLLRGELAREDGDTAAAGRFWKRVPDYPATLAAKARVLDGMLLLEAARAREAEAAFSRAAELDPEIPEPHEGLLRICAIQSREPEIRRELEALRRIRTWKLTELYQLANASGEAVSREEAIPQLERFTASDPDDFCSLVALGRYYLWDERPAAAAVVLKRALSRRPDEQSIRALLAEALLRQSDVAGARDALRTTTPARDSPQPLWRSYGLFLAAEGDWQAAAVCLRRAAAMKPDDRTALYQLALTLERAGETDEAAQVLQRVQTLVQLKAALFKFVQAADARPEVSISALELAGETLMHLGRFEEAALFFEQVLVIDPSRAPVREKLESARRRQSAVAGEPPGAAEDQRLNGAIAAAARFAASSPSSEDCAREKGLRPLPSIRFVDRHFEAGVDFQYANGARGEKLLLETTGGGVAVLDFDADGWPDLFFPQGGSLPLGPRAALEPDRLYRNRGDGTFCDVTPSTGLDDNQYSQGCAAADYDNDGFTDVAIANCGTNMLYRNNGDGTFANVTSGSGVVGVHWSTSLGWGDVNGDGNVDLYIVNYVADHLQSCRNRTGVAPCHPQIFEAEPDELYVSRGDGTFDEVLGRSGMAASQGRGLGLLIADLNDDGWPDVYVANDANPSFLFQNLGPSPNGQPRFKEVGFASGLAVNGAGNTTAAMGIAAADLDDDGRTDLFVTNFYQEADILYLNRGALLFEDATRQAGLVESTKATLGWGTQTIDADLDGGRRSF